MFGEFEAFLSILTFVPAIGALVIAIFRFTTRAEDQALIDKNSRMVAWVATMVVAGMVVAAAATSQCLKRSWKQRLCGCCSRYCAISVSCRQA